MLVYGAGGHAKVIISILKATAQNVEAIFDDDTSRFSVLNVPVAGNYNPDLFPNEKLIIAIGHNLIRRRLLQKITHEFGTLVHPSAVIEDSATIGAGTCVMQNAVIQADSVIGKHVIINTSSSIDHDCRIGDFVHISPGVVLGGNVTIGENTLIGIGSIIVPGLSVGKNCLVSAGSVVTINIPDGAIVRGNPARIISRTP